jgi:hypothetical protein
MTGVRIANCMGRYALAWALFAAPLQAQELPTDDQIPTAFGAVYNRLGLMECCQSKDFADASDVANTAPVLQPAEHDLDPVSLAVDVGIVRDRQLFDLPLKGCLR